jgi:hypothetical protein
MKLDSDVYMLILMPVLVFFMFAIIIWPSENVGWKKKAAQTECAQFHPKTGKFEWIEQ